MFGSGVRSASGLARFSGADNDPIEVGERSNIQDGALLHSDPGFPLTIGADVTVGHHAIVHGCIVGANTLIGMGSTILNGAKSAPIALSARTRSLRKARSSRISR